MGTIVLEADWTLVSDGDALRLVQDHEVVIEGDRIADVRERRAGGKSRLRAWGQLLLPGFISAHTHAAAGTAGRGLAEDVTPWFDAEQLDGGGNEAQGRPGEGQLSLSGPLRHMELMEGLSDEELDDLTVCNLVEMLRSGCTTQVEMSLSLRQLRAYLRAAERLGVRGYPAAMVPDIGRVTPIWARDDDQVLADSVPATLSEIRASADLAQSINGSLDDRIRPMMAVTLTSAHTRETLLAVRDAAERLGNGIQLHVQADEGIVRSCGKREVPLLDDLGLLDQVVFGSHLIGVDLDEDMSLLAERRFTFVHCPSSGGAGLHPGSQPYPEALAAGVNTAIGLDAHSNDFVETIKLAVIQGRAREHLLSSFSPRPLRRPSVWDAVRSATLSAARGLGRDDLGRVAPGAKADLCTIELTGLFVGAGSVPPAPLNNLLYANGLAVRNVMTDGVWQLRDGEIAVEDEARVVERRGAIMRRLRTQLVDEGWFVPRLASD